MKRKFPDELCGPKKDTHFFVGTVLSHPGSRVVIGVYYPTKPRPQSVSAQKTLSFDE
ncbi:MAG: hypothetical protein KDA89_13665 [Planctomycetaceae bacterium]|nr:hypothetical protein [Planctomycetaceae bacterium]